LSLFSVGSLVKCVAAELVQARQAGPLVKIK